MDDKERQKQKNYVLWLLSRQDYSTKQIERKLIQRNVDKSYIQELISWCQNHAFIDDARFCESYIIRQTNKLLGYQRIKADAYHKGLNQELFETIINEMEIDWYQLAQSAYNKKFSKINTSLDYKEKAKRMRYLSYRGFNHDQIEFAMQSNPSDE